MGAFHSSSGPIPSACEPLGVRLEYFNLMRNTRIGSFLNPSLLYGNEDGGGNTTIYSVGVVSRGIPLTRLGERLSLTLLIAGMYVTSFL